MNDPLHVPLAGTMPLPLMRRHMREKPFRKKEALSRREANRL